MNYLSIISQAAVWVVSIMFVGLVLAPLAGLAMGLWCNALWTVLSVLGRLGLSGYAVLRAHVAHPSSSASAHS